jgi:glutaredoxin
MNLVRALAFALLAAALCTAAGAQVFKWTDAAGKTHYGDRPPEEAKKQELRIRATSFDGPVEVRDWSAVLKRRPEGDAPVRSGVTMYSTDWCGHCRNARNYFKAKGIAFTEIDVEKSESGKREFQALGGGGVPLILAGGKSMRGFSAAAFEALHKP